MVYNKPFEVPPCQVGLFVPKSDSSVGLRRVALGIVSQSRPCRYDKAERRRGPIGVVLFLNT